MDGAGAELDVAAAALAGEDVAVDHVRAEPGPVVAPHERGDAQLHETERRGDGAHLAVANRRRVAEAVELAEPEVAEADARHLLVDGDELAARRLEGLAQQRDALVEVVARDVHRLLCRCNGGWWRVFWRGGERCWVCWGGVLRY